jgi:hypothetical protein
LDDEIAHGIIRLLMRIDAKLDQILEVIDEDGSTEADA